MINQLTEVNYCLYVQCKFCTYSEKFGKSLKISSNRNVCSNLMPRREAMLLQFCLIGTTGRRPTMGVTLLDSFACLLTTHMYYVIKSSFHFKNLMLAAE